MAQYVSLTVNSPRPCIDGASQSFVACEARQCSRLPLQLNTPDSHTAISATGRIKTVLAHPRVTLQPFNGRALCCRVGNLVKD